MDTERQGPGGECVQPCVRAQPTAAHALLSLRCMPAQQLRVGLVPCTGQVVNASGVVDFYNQGQSMGSLPDAAQTKVQMGAITCVRLSRDTKRAYLGSADGALYAWDLKRQVRCTAELCCRLTRTCAHCALQSQAHTRAHTESVPAPLATRNRTCVYVRVLCVCVHRSLRALFSTQPPYHQLHWMKSAWLWQGTHTHIHTHTHT